ncbi:hypothetical protein [Epibacterium sp. Ofav1-8]|uniref:hypothetical protein n=1 Tax=Epibacterium sp. Ofav1-8 TaxID=2917735 RepID=UPI001EF45B7E|nr:hypothetical protein [Epibacterium sp. Ofav1-8]MCG7622243.1 hypothetical protein [Epibacterium sp. Ofav1-8]
MTLRLDPAKIVGASFGGLEPPVADAADQHAYWEDFNARFFRSNGQEYDPVAQSNVENWLSAPDRASFAAMAEELLNELRQHDPLEDVDLVLLAHWMPDLHLGTSVTNFALHWMDRPDGFGFAISDRGLSAPLFAIDCAARYLTRQGRRALVMTMDQKHLLYRSPTAEQLQPENSASLLLLESEAKSGLCYRGYRRHIQIEEADLPAVLDTSCRDLGLDPSATVLISDDRLRGLDEGFADWRPAPSSQMCAAPLRALMGMPATRNNLLMTWQDQELCVVGFAAEDGGT